MRRLAFVVLLTGAGCGSSGPAGGVEAGGPDVVFQRVPDAGRDGARDAVMPASDGRASVPDVAAPPVDAPLAKEAGPLDAPAGDASALFAACRGAPLALTVSDEAAYVEVGFGSEAGDTGAVLLDYGSTFSSIDLGAFAAPGPSTSGCNSADLGETCNVADVSFFGPASTLALVTEDFSGLGGAVRQAGIFGTDVLSNHVLTLDYAAGFVYGASSACSPAVLAADGLVPLSVAGFFENDTSLLAPLTTVDDAGGTGSVPDVPFVRVSIAGVMGRAQLDTGFSDTVTPFSVNVNQAFFDAVTEAAPGMLVRDASLDESLTTCVEGVSQSATAYRLATGATFALVADAGGAARSYSQAVIFLKSAPSGAAECGGITTFSAPAAQLGASFYIDMGRLVFDPFGATVWVPAE